MEVEKTKEELLAFLEMNTANSSAGIALRDFIRDSANNGFLKVTDDTSSSSEIEETIEDVREEGRDDEDFIIMMQPKALKKKDKKIGMIKAVSSSKSKRKCEFCGTLETPMWRRGPTGKGTLCNACGVKWSLKFRKRAGKKVNKVDKIRDEPREQRLSTRKKIPTKKSIEFGPSNGPIPDIPMDLEHPKEESSAHQHIGLCCNHSTKRRRSEDNIDQDIKRRRDNASHDDDSISDSTPIASNKLLGKLLNVVEVQLVEEEELDRVKKAMRQLRNDMEITEANSERLYQESRDNIVQDVLDLKREVLASYNKEKEEIGAMMNDFASNIRSHVEEIRKSLGDSASNDLSSRLNKIQTEMEEMKAKFAIICDKKSAENISPIEKIFIAKEEQLGSKYEAIQGEMDQDFAELHDRLETIEDPIMREP